MSLKYLPVLFSAKGFSVTDFLASKKLPIDFLAILPVRNSAVENHRKPCRLKSYHRKIYRQLSRVQRIMPHWKVDENGLILDINHYQHKQMEQTLERI